MPDYEWIKETAEGVSLTVKVRPKSRQTRVDAVTSEFFRIAVRAAPQDGQANEACVELLAMALKVPKSAVKIAVGFQGRTKIVKVSGLTRQLVLERLSGLAFQPRQEGI